MEEQDTYQVTATVAPVADNDKGLRMTFTDMVTGAIVEWQVEEVSGRSLRLLYAAFNDDALEEMFRRGRGKEGTDRWNRLTASHRSTVRCWTTKR